MKNVMMATVLGFSAITIFAGSTFAQPVFGIPQTNGVVRTYLLKVGSLESNATFDGSKLVVTRGFESTVYDRMETLDSRDGQYLGFYSLALDKTIRFPIAGNGRIQLEGDYGNWKWSQMFVTPTTVTVPVFSEESAHEHIDDLALNIQRQAQEISNEASVHYRHTPEYNHLVTDLSEVLQQSVHLHDLAHEHGSVAHMAADLAKLDASFHHLETTFGRIELTAAHGGGHIHGNTAHVKRLLASMEDDIHHLGEEIESLQRHVVLRPKFGTFSNIDGLAQRLESLSNEFLLDMYHNYSHNLGFNEAYREAYQILTTAKSVHSLAHHHDHAAIQQKLNELNGLVHHLEDDLRGWTRHQHQPIGRLGIKDKLSSVEGALNELMDDAGVVRTQLAPPPSSGTAPPPQILAP